MSYAAGHNARPSRSRIQVGHAAGRDVILAQASWDASRILMHASRLSRGRRLSFIRRQMRVYGPGSVSSFDERRQQLLRSGSAPNQATYDAMRLVAANSYAREGEQAIRAALAEKVSGEFADGLGGITKKGRNIGCGIMGGTTMAAGLVASIYGGAGGGSAVGAGGSMVSGALQCNKEELEAQQRIADAQAKAAQATADAALEAARIQERTQSRVAEERTKQIKTVAVIGGALVLLLATGYAIVKV